MQVFLFIPVFIPPNNSLENISNFYLPIFNPAAKNLFFSRKNMGGAGPPPLQPPSYAYVHRL
jgi:hypothetical protein